MDLRPSEAARRMRERRKRSVSMFSACRPQSTGHVRPRALRFRWVHRGGTHLCAVGPSARGTCTARGSFSKGVFATSTILPLSSRTNFGA